MGKTFLIGILASNQKAKTLRCLESLASSTCREFDVFLVDNDSREGIGEAASRFTFVTSSIQNRNTGCAGGRNLILDHFESEGDWSYLFFLDNDAVVEPNTLETLAQRADACRRDGISLGALAPHVVFMDKPDVFWCAGGALIDRRQSRFTNNGQGKGTNDPAFQSPRRLDTLTGGFMVASREAIRATGRFVEDYFIYVEDTDWCWRMKQSGYELLSVPEARVLHDASSSVGGCSPRFHYYRTRNRLWFFQAFSPLSRSRVLRSVFSSVFANTIRMELGSGRVRAAMGAMRGLLHGMRVPLRVRENAGVLTETAAAGQET